MLISDHEHHHSYQERQRLQEEALDAQRAVREEQERRDRELAARLKMETDEESAGSLFTAPAREANM